ncbi:MAG: hypothetical protein V4714_21575 [Bacteroidota bacterium]
MKFFLCILFNCVFTPPSDPITAGDKLFFQMNYAEAILQYQAEPKSPEALWKIARAYICQADVSPIEKQKSLYYKAVENARQCIKLNEKDSNGHTWLGAALGNIAMYEGSRSKIKLCNSIKLELERALVLNPKDDVALSIMGSFYRALGNISWLERTLANTFLGALPKGNFSDGELALKKAIQLSPSTMRHWFELGLLYRDWGKEALASKTFQSAQQLPILMGSDKLRLSRIKLILAEIN